jgi:hypothetical protein
MLKAGSLPTPMGLKCSAKVHVRTRNRSSAIPVITVRHYTPQLSNKSSIVFHSSSKQASEGWIDAPNVGRKKEVVSAH